MQQIVVGCGLLGLLLLSVGVFQLGRQRPAVVLGQQAAIPVLLSTERSAPAAAMLFQVSDTEIADFDSLTLAKNSPLT